jgi:hypothetical protein
MIEIEYSQGVCMDGAAILRDGAMMTVDDIVGTLNALQARVAELDAKLSRLTAAGRALADDIVSRIPVDDEGFQPYDGDMAVWDELHAALSEAGK